jgi:phosphohistidine phosphatase
MKLEHPRIVLDDILYEASARQLLDHINNVEDAYGEVLLIAHNPAISYLAEYLTKADIGDMQPCSAVIIKFDLPSWKLVSEKTGALEKYVTAESVARF